MDLGWLSKSIFGYRIGEVMDLGWVTGFRVDGETGLSCVKLGMGFKENRVKELT